MDEKFLLLINREWTHPALDLIMAAVSCFDAWTWWMLIGAVIMLKVGGFRARVFLISVALIIGVNDGVIAKQLKRIVDRPRPHQVLHDVRQVDLVKARPRFLALAKPPVVQMSRPKLQEVEGRSFPSGHTVNMFSTAVVAIAAFGRSAWWTFLIAGTVGYSRIYTGAHWPSDVLATIPLAIGATLLLLALLEWAWQRFGSHWLPEVHALHPTLLAA